MIKQGNKVKSHNKETKDLIRQLNDPNKEIRENAVQRLFDIGEPAIEPLIKAIDKSPAFDCIKEVLVKIGEPVIIPLSIRAASLRPYDNTLHLSILGDLGPAVAKRMVLYANTIAGTAHCAAIGWAMCYGDQYISELIEIFKNGNAKVASSAMTLLECTPWSSMIHIREMIQNSELEGYKLELASLALDNYEKLPD